MSSASLSEDLVRGNRVRGGCVAVSMLGANDAQDTIGYQLLRKIMYRGTLAGAQGHTHDLCFH